LTLSERPAHFAFRHLVDCWRSEHADERFKQTHRQAQAAAPFRALHGDDRAPANGTRHVRQVSPKHDGKIEPLARVDGQKPYRVVLIGESRRL
jgi:hypothetical protein